MFSRVKELLGLGSRTPSAAPFGRIITPTEAPVQHLSSERATPAPTDSQMSGASADEAVEPLAAIDPQPVTHVPTESAVGDFEQEWLGEHSADHDPDLAARLNDASSSEEPELPVEALWGDPDGSFAWTDRPAHGSSRPGINVADAFAALLAAEQGESPGPMKSTARDAEQMEVLVSQVALRVAERLGTAAVRERVDDIVRAVAERLVREEIDRIRTTAAERHE